MGLPVTCTSAVAAELGFDDEDGVHVDADLESCPPPENPPQMPSGHRSRARSAVPAPQEAPRTVRNRLSRSSRLKPGQIRGATAGGLEYLS